MRLLSSRRRGHRVVRHRHHASSARARAPLLGFSKDAPPSRNDPRVHSRAVTRSSARGCHPRARSVLAVPPGFDGFLRALRRRSVAPCTRSWGSARFRLHRSRTSLDAARDLCLPRRRASHPSELSPRRPPYRVTAALALSPFVRVPKDTPRSQGLALPTSPLSREALPPTSTRCSPGLRSPPGSSPNSLRDPSPAEAGFTSLDLPWTFATLARRGPAKIRQRDPVALSLPREAGLPTLLGFLTSKIVSRSPSRPLSSVRRPNVSVPHVLNATPVPTSASWSNADSRGGAGKHIAQPLGHPAPARAGGAHPITPSGSVLSRGKGSGLPFGK